MAKDIQVNQTINKLVYGAMIELMLESYGNTDRLIGYNHTLKVKHKNLITDWKKQSKELFDFIEGPGNENMVKQYHSIVNVVEQILAIDDLNKFTDILNFIEEYLKGDIKIVEK